MLKGKRVTLRGIRRDDLPRLWEFNNDVEVEVAGAGDPPIPQSLERLQAEFDTHAQKGGRDETAFAIEADGKFIGQCALYGFDQFRGVAHGCELGIAIGDKAYWDGGYGTDAMRALCRFGFDIMNLHRIQLDVYAGNQRAQHVYEKVGFRIEARKRQGIYKFGAYQDVLVMGLLEGELRLDD